ncbi:response regulator transcription factor [Luteolibacter sp. LG18]|uniref:response regulator transcription factor n=1 Tax=Luteolibacter sp. LG18 TaxID=2819286 RepID=UPI002B2C2B15|nr:DNA-binding response regulator [Luteolibacter sp. LG18]
MNARILLVEDEPGIAEVVSDLLQSEGHAVEVAADGREGLRMAGERAYDLLLLDVMLPGISGFELCDAVRDRGFGGGILMLTARGEVADRVQGLKTGADDYLVKPFDPDELLARIEALMRRVAKPAAAGPVMRFGSVTADFVTGALSKNGTVVNLAAKELELLRVLASHPGRVFSRDEILQRVWPEQPFITSRTVDVHIVWLRQKIEEVPQMPRHIVTVRGTGYRFDG